MARRGKDKKREEFKRKRKRISTLMSMVKDVVTALVIVVVIMSSLYIYSGGIWPPMVVVESESMMHGDDSQIGVIDTGDLTLVKKIGSKGDIVTWVEGKEDFDVEWIDNVDHHGPVKFHGDRAPFETYGDSGEVVIYRKNGKLQEVQTPVIHRAMLWVEPNTDPDCLNNLPPGKVTAGNFPDIKNKANPKGIECVISLTLEKVGYRKENLVIDVNRILGNAIALEGKAFAGFLTKGDHNPPRVDQESLNDGLPTNRPLSPIKVGWVVGEAVGELPWFGALKLVLSGTRDSKDIPPSSWNGLIVTIISFILIPFILDIVSMQREKARKRKRKKKDGPGHGGEDPEAEKVTSKNDGELAEDEDPDLDNEMTSEDDMEDLEMEEDFEHEFDEMAKAPKREV